MKIRNINCATNTMLSRFGYCSSEVKSLLFTSYCTSFYGCPLWDLSTKYIGNCYISWRKCVRCVWGLPYRRHSRYTYVLQNVVILSMYNWSIDLHVLCLMLFNNNPIIVSCSKLCNYSNTSVARNRRILLEWLNDNGSIFLNSFSMIKCNFHHKTLYSQNDIIEIMLIKVKELWSYLLNNVCIT